MKQIADELEPLIKAYDDAQAAWAPRGKRLAELQHECQNFIMRHYVKPPDALADIYRKVDNLIRELDPASLAASELAALKTQLIGARTEAREAGERAQAAATGLMAAVQPRNNEAIMATLLRRRAMTQEIVTFLIPYCESENQAKDLAEQCGQVAALEFEAASLRTIPTLPGRARRLMNKK